MRDILFLIMGLILIVFGAVLLTKKKIIMSRVAEQIFISIILLVNVVSSYSDQGIVILLLLIWMPMFFLTGKYSIYNIDKEAVTLLVKEILTEKNYKNEWIKLNSSFLNTVELNLREIRDTQMYSDILNEIKIRLRYVEKKFFPYAGMAYIGLGIFVLWIVIK